MSFYYSLRYTLDPRANTAAKDAKLLEFCKAGQIDNVTFFINSEELNAGHLTLPQLQVWLDAIAPVQKQLAAIGVTTSLNPWSTIMHSDRGPTVPAELGFDTMVDVDGKQAAIMACPADERWVDYMAASYGLFARLHPRELWLEDDFRHYNHTPLRLACFCDRHMALYAKEMGAEESRSEFVTNLLATGAPTPERNAYLTVARREMIHVAQRIEMAVHAVSPETKVALMTSFPDWHAVEGRDWPGLLDALAGTKHERVARPHLPAYNELAPNHYGRVFEQYTRTTAAYLGDNATLLPELENYMYSPFAKSKAFTQFQIETAALVGAKGILLNLFDMMGNGIVDDYGYADMLAQSKPFLSAITESRLRMSTTTGIQVLVNQNSAATLHTEFAPGGIRGDITPGAPAHTPDRVEPADLLPQETHWAELLSMFGFSTTITPWTAGTHFSGQTLAVSGQFLRNLDDAGITQLLHDNRVLLDADCVQVLFDRGLTDLIHARSAAWLPVRSGHQTYMAMNGHTYAGVADPRTTLLQHIGDLLRIDYEPDAHVQIWSTAYHQDGTVVGNGISAIDGHIFILPLNTDTKYRWEAHYNNFEQELFQQLLSENGDADFLRGMPNVKLVDTPAAMLLANFSLDSYPLVRWHPGRKVHAKTATIRSRNADGYVETTVPLVQDGSDITFAVPLAGLQTMQIQLH